MADDSQARGYGFLLGLIRSLTERLGGCKTKASRKKLSILLKLQNEFVLRRYLVLCIQLEYTQIFPFVTDDKDILDETTSNNYWIDVKLGRGDLDSYDIERYIRVKFLDYISPSLATNEAD